jgi:WD40 repeat protein
VHQLVFSGDGRRLLSVGGDGSARLWNGQSGEPIRELSGARDWQYSAAISHDGRVAAAGGWDGLVRLWDADSGRLHGTLVQPPDPNASLDGESSHSPGSWLAITPGGFVAGSSDLIGAVRWKAGETTLPTEAARRVCLSPESVACALRGELTASVAFPPIQSRN